MDQQSNDQSAVAKDALIMLNQEVSVSGTGQRSNNAAVKDVQTKLGQEDCA